MLDEAKVARLVRLAERLDESGEAPEVLRSLLDEFNREAGTDVGLDAFRGIYGVVDHGAWVRRLLSAGAARVIPDVTYDELLELTTRVCEHDGAAHEIEFWFAVLEKNVADPQRLEPIYYPEAYSGGALGHDPGPREILDAALAAPPARSFAPPAGGGATGT